MITGNKDILVSSRPEFNFEEKTLDDLKQIRKNFNLKQIRDYHFGEAYLIRMVDILLEKIERLENDNQ